MLLVSVREGPGPCKSKWHPNIENKSKVQIHTSAAERHKYKSRRTMIHMSMQSGAWRCALKLYTYHELLLLLLYYCYYNIIASAPAWINSHSIVQILARVRVSVCICLILMYECSTIYAAAACTITLQMLPMYRHSTMCTWVRMQICLLVNDKIAHWMDFAAKPPSDSSSHTFYFYLHHLFVVHSSSTFVFFSFGQIFQTPWTRINICK